ncbi:MAG: HesA/MoeB/ThiF family protein [Betaproteobacteria bacterium]|nr:HesA/MoeB/ThiF family protein [Betaproteobacteria bacterium]
MDDQSLLRYSRHLLLNEFGIEAQQRLAQSSALVIGAGGLGSAALMYLASAGVSRVTVADGDQVDLTNLQRQIIHRESSVGVNKALSAAKTLSAINSTIEICAVEHRLEGSVLHQQVAAADVVLDCSDNFRTRHAINRACVQFGKPLVSGAGIRFDGQLTSFDFRRSDTPCYHCLFPDDPEAEEERCAVMGVFAPVVGIIGAMQAAEAIRLLTEVGQPLTGRLLMLDARNMSWQSVKFRRDDQCAICSNRETESFKELEYASN